MLKEVKEICEYTTDRHYSLARIKEICKECDEYDILMAMADELDREGLYAEADVIDDKLRSHKESEEYRIVNKGW